MQFSDIHIHALCNCDDGAKSLDCMYKMIDTEYSDGVRYLCLTPHYNPGYFGENTESTNKSFDALLEYARDKYNDLHIMLGNELRYNPGCVSWLTDGRCRCLNNKYVLVDFWERESKETISKGLDKLLNAGYIPIFAHAERYTAIRNNISFLKEQQANGVMIQINAGSLFGTFGFGARLFCNKILQNYIADFVSSDAHNLSMRPPGIKKAYEYIENKNGKDYADAICFKNAYHLIFNS